MPIKTTSIPPSLGPSFHPQNAGFIEEMYQQFELNPASVSKNWQQYFSSLKTSVSTNKIAQVSTKTPSHTSKDSLHFDSVNSSKKQAAVLQLINAYRFRAHQVGNWDPLQLKKYGPIEDLEPIFHGLTDKDMDTQFHPGSLCIDGPLSLKEIIDFLKQVYMGPIASEYMHITSTEEKRWLQNYLESRYIDHVLSEEKEKNILYRLIAANTFEKYLHTRYSGQKRFSLEGGESLIPLLDELIQHAGEEEIEEISLGMTHRGRLNVLVNTLGKPTAELFNEFEEETYPTSDSHTGDVKYHLGFSTDIGTSDSIVHVAMAFNPSHLEIIDPVVQGSVRARQRRRKDKQGETVLPVLIHGDAAFAGQGVVMETFNMSQAHEFSTDGTIHIIVNNQIGFTTNPTEGRSGFYCTEVAKMVQAPILHVNGDHPECVTFVTRLALDYRMTYHKDIVIDMVCCRRHGHNEADEPSATQPLMYKKIKQHPTVLETYSKHLVKKGTCTHAFINEAIETYRNKLSQGDIVAPNIKTGIVNIYATDWQKFSHTFGDSINTQVSEKRFHETAKRALSIPKHVSLHSRVEKIYRDRERMLAGEIPVDWGFAEIMAYATLLKEGYHVRLSGQDSQRGTFFHRHATLHDQTTGEIHTPLQHLSTEQGDFTAIDSPLSEAAVLGFEYGYATTDANSLVIWEAQFGDFANGAQVIIDQFISSAEAKWNRLCGITLLLPHGQEGQGPEHSSARIERYLQLCAHHNMRVCIPTTPAQIFHLLRQQMLDQTRKPLIVFTPKSLLRHTLATSTLAEITAGAFVPLINDTKKHQNKRVKKLILCCGKIYYDLWSYRKKQKIENIPVLRLEQLYPFPSTEMKAVLATFPNLETVVWVQEEPANQGAWYQIQHHIRNHLTEAIALKYIARPMSASPAVGYASLYKAKQEKIIKAAFK